MGVNNLPRTVTQLHPDR